MKLKLLIYLGILAIPISSCFLQKIATDKQEKALIGRWDILSIASPAKPDSALLPDFSSMLQTLLVNALIEFSPDHTFRAEIAGKNYNGSWQADSKSKTIRILEKGKEVIYAMRRTKNDEIDLRTKTRDREYYIKLTRPSQKVLVK